MTHCGREKETMGCQSHLLKSRKTKEWLERVLLPEVCCFFFLTEIESFLWYSKILQSYQEIMVLKINLDKSLLLSTF